MMDMEEEDNEGGGMDDNGDDGGMAQEYNALPEHPLDEQVEPSHDPGIGRLGDGAYPWMFIALSGTGPWAPCPVGRAACTTEEYNSLPEHPLDE